MSSRILVVDDEEAIVDAVSYALRGEGYDVDSAGDGEAGATAHADTHPRRRGQLARRPFEERPHLDPLQGQGLLAHLCAREQQERVRQAVQSRAMVAEVVEEAITLFRHVLRTRLEDLECADHRSERRPELVSRVRDELALYARAFLQLA